MKKIFSLLIGISLVCTCYAQQDILKQYLQEAGNNAVIYNGKLVENYPRVLFQDLPYWKSEAYLPGSIIYGGRPYGHLLLRFDIYKEQLEVQTPEKHLEIDLNMPLISEFSIDGVKFAHGESLPENIPEQGYLRVLYENENIKFLAKHKCILNVAIAQKGQSFTFRTRYYLCVDGEWHLIRNKKSIYNLFPTYRKQLKKYMADQHHDDKEQQMCSVIEYLQSLINQTAEL
ncbi:hypothetical protein [Phocaeicola sp.]